LRNTYQVYLTLQPHSHHQIIHFSWRPLSRISCIFVAPPQPRPGLVAPLQRPVEPLVHPPERVEAARVGGVGVVDDAVGERERTHALEIKEELEKKWCDVKY
jgi:hypothetical protein